MNSTRAFSAHNGTRRSMTLLFALVLSIIMTGMMGTPAFSQNWRLAQPSYPTTDAFVITYSVADYGATGDGVTDVTSIFQDRLNALGTLGGGTLYVPAGKYVIRGTLLIPKGITLRGEWQKPTKGQPINGTILMAYAGRGDENATPFITMQTSAAVRDLAIWYPEQLPDNITPYPPAIIFGAPNYFGNEFCNAKNLTFVNAYTGILFSRTNGGTCPVINGIYGTPLSRGVEIDNIVDVGRIENINLSPAYWAGSGLPNAPAAGGGYANWIYQNGTGIVMRRNDWSYTAFVDIEGYAIGFHATTSIPSAPAIPNGQNYAMTFTNCKTGIYAEVVSNVGIMFARCTTVNCATGLAIGGGASTNGALQLHTCTFGGSIDAITADPTCVARIMLQQCTITGGNVNVGGGTFAASDCDFNNKAPQIVLGANARGIITGNRFKNGVNIENNSLYTNAIDHTPLTLKKLPPFPTITQPTHKPSRQVLYLATAAPFNAKPDGVTDNTTAIQNALTKASTDGGGIVFLPPGKYKVTGHLTVPTNVELKGAADNSTTPTGPGAVLEPYADKGNPNGTPFIKLSAGSGLQGITINYPEQLASLVPNFPAYPYTIQVTGSDVYIINVGLRAVYNGIDMFTYQCNNHYVDWLTGHVFHNAIKVGGGTSGGQISNTQFNTIAYAAGAESKFGSWPNSPQGDNAAIYSYQLNNMDFIILGNAQNEILYNDFVYGAHHGLILANEGSGASGISMGLGLDGTKNAISFEKLGAGGFDFINSQIVALNNNQDTSTSYLNTTGSFNGQINLYNSDYWGNPARSVVSDNGAINMQTANFAEPGFQNWGLIRNGSLNIHNSTIWPVGTLLNAGAEPKFSAHSSIVDSANIDAYKATLWKNNLGNIWGVSVAGAMDRQGWTASASVNTNNAKNALDSNTVTRWDTQGSQVNGQTFTVDMKTVNTINRIVLDATDSPSDSPAGYSAYISNDGTNWGSPIASGTGPQGMTLITFPEKVGRYIRIVQTGAKGNYWSIHEFYVFGRVNVASVSVTPSSGSLNIGSTQKLTATILPANATNKAKNWTSSNPAIATVDTSGKVTTIAPGIVTITVTTVDGNKTASCIDTVKASNNAYGGTPAAIPGKIEAENFDNGGQGLAYSDADPTNSGGLYRSEGVDVEACSDGGYDVGYIAAGEWLNYTVNITTPGTYTLQTRIASPYGSRRLHVELDGVNISGTINVPNTNGWQTFQTLTATTPALTTGIKTLRIVMETDGFNLDYLTLTRTGTASTTKLADNTADADIIAYPNPVTGNQLNLQLINHTAGKYHVILFNSLNQPVFTTAINVSNVSNVSKTTSTYPLSLQHTLPAGYYMLEVIDQKGNREVKKIIVQ
ncbi:carbohydrate-binding protein [Chitinophaga ginsengisoli]|uniref:Putative secreted protein (Por secretion system target) n=1 Tax=Chitinophaga ginsengisoli TaxID=363837 RepID=A0A2P8FNK3_9BACT|nr:glycosyl hydrolase family 28-related protein [Chitinophaga ginsengisoli]PSL23302.1 putative secreted protein (Por secretion system target) [Chitinophaga ginsengisoli]